MNATVIIDLVMALIARIQKAVALIKQARAEDRDITEAELDVLVADDDAARAALQAAIDKAKAEGR